MSENKVMVDTMYQDITWGTVENQEKSLWSLYWGGYVLIKKKRFKRHF